MLSAEVEHTSGDFYRFTVTVKHDDESWEHFAKAWEILDLEGNILGARILLHPHIDEQPFTRSLSGIVIKYIQLIFQVGS